MQPFITIPIKHDKLSQYSSVPTLLRLGFKTLSQICTQPHVTIQVKQDEPSRRFTHAVSLVRALGFVTGLYSTKCHHTSQARRAKAVL